MPILTAERIRKARRVYLIGNGGSFANAMHIANDLIGCGIKAYTIDPATLTAMANDFGYEITFSRWISTVGEEGDLLIALSGSGTSSNITKAIEIAKIKGMDWVLVTRFLKGMDMQESEEEQIKLGHDLMRELRSCA